MRLADGSVFGDRFAFESQRPNGGSVAESNDDALQVALAQFNDGLKTQQAEERARKAIEKAERKKQQAASELKAVQANPDASADDKAAADAAYREAVDTFNRMRSGEPEPDSSEDSAAKGEEPTATESTEPGDDSEAAADAEDDTEAAADAEVAADTSSEAESDTDGDAETETNTEAEVSDEAAGSPDAEAETVPDDADAASEA